MEHETETEQNNNNCRQVFFFFYGRMMVCIMYGMCAMCKVQCARCTGGLIEHIVHWCTAS